MGRYQNGCLRREKRKSGDVWVFRYYASRALDGKRVERTLSLGPVADFPSESAARKEIDRRRLREAINDQPEHAGAPTFAEIAAHYVTHELSTGSIRPKSHTTIGSYKRALNLRILPRWDKFRATEVKALEVEQWLSALRIEHDLEFQTLVKARNVMRLVFEHAIRHDLVPALKSNPIANVRCRTESDYEALVVTPEQAYQIIIELPMMEQLLVLLSACTGLRMGESLGLKWRDINFAARCIHIRRGYTNGQEGRAKTLASRASVPMADVLATYFNRWREETTYAKDDDWVFASTRAKGKKPRSGNSLVIDYLRPAAVKVGVLTPDSKIRFGLHNFRHSLASYLVTSNTDIKTVQSILRHANPQVTLGLYAKANTEAKLTAQGKYLEALLPAKAVPADTAGDENLTRDGHPRFGNEGVVSGTSTSLAAA